MILIVAEHVDGKLSKSAYELTQAARQLGREGPITLFVLGHEVDTIVAAAATLGEQVLVADHPALAEYDPEIWAAAVAQVAREGEASTVLIGGSRSGREYSPRVAVKMEASLIEDAISLQDEDGSIRAEHYTFLARVTEYVQAEGALAVVTVKPGSFAPAEPNSELAEQYDVDLEIPQRRLVITEKLKETADRVSLAEAEIVVAGGRGLGSAEAFHELVVGLADELNAAVGATRAVVDAGWRPYSEQVGQTGKTVHPKMYIAVGISGAVQHLSGMGKSKVIVAINKDADAPIFRAVDYGVVGDVREVVPAVIRELHKTV